MILEAFLCMGSDEIVKLIFILCCILFCFSIFIFLSEYLRYIFPCSHYVKYIKAKKGIVKTIPIKEFTEKEKALIKLHHEIRWAEIEAEKFKIIRPDIKNNFQYSYPSIAEPLCGNCLNMKKQNDEKEKVSDFNTHLFVMQQNKDLMMQMILQNTLNQINSY